jgi:hypothetical protein
MKALSQFGHFWYDFIVGDDWTIAVAVVVLLSVTAAIAHTGRLAWPILPAGVALILGASTWRARRTQERSAHEQVAPRSEPVDRGERGTEPS